MHSISSRWRKPKGRPSKRKKAAVANALKRTCPSISSESGLPTVRIQPLPVPAITDHSKAINYTVMDEDAWSALLKEVPCSECSSINSLRVSAGQSYGFSRNIELICSECGHSFGKTFSSTREETSRKFSVNQNFVHAFLSIGKGHAALEAFSMSLGLPSMDKKTFSKCLHEISANNQILKSDILTASRDQVRETYINHNFASLVDGVLDITVSYDGTWQKRGHASLYGIGSVIDVLTGLVVDFEILSKYCPECTSAARDLGKKSPEFTIWQEGHKTNCQKNFDGSSNSMEMCAAFTIWKRSISMNKMRYLTVLSDGDAKTHHHLNEKKVYGDVIISKEDCINHVSKRLGTALRNKVKEWRLKGVTISGRKTGNLKDDTITKLQNYYRKAIKENAPDIPKMKAAVFATLYHMMSTDKKPRHGKCPSGPSSWCFYQRALALNETPKSHSEMKTKLLENVVEKILPVYQRLGSDEILKRCVSAKTQNANETLHSCIWSKCPKEVFVSKKRLEIAVNKAVSEFNFGCMESLKLSCKDIHADSAAIAKKRDSRREQQKQRRSKGTQKQRHLKKISNSKKEKLEGVTYGAGLF